MTHTANRLDSEVVAYLHTTTSKVYLVSSSRDLVRAACLPTVLRLPNSIRKQHKAMHNRSRLAARALNRATRPRCHTTIRTLRTSTTATLTTMATAFLSPSSSTPPCFSLVHQDPVLPHLRRPSRDRALLIPNRTHTARLYTRNSTRLRLMTISAITHSTSIAMLRA
jgi:hypothetical protein